MTGWGFTALRTNHTPLYTEPTSSTTRHSRIMSVTPVSDPKSRILALLGRQVHIQSPIDASMERLKIDYETLWKACWFHIHHSAQKADIGADGRTRGIPENAKGGTWQLCSDVCQPRQVLRALRRVCRSHQRHSSGIRLPANFPKHARSCIVRGRNAHGQDSFLNSTPGR